MKNIFKALAIIVVVTVIGFSMACGGIDDGGNDVPPEKNLWDVWRENSSTATLNYSIANDGVCTVTVGGTPEKHGVDGVWNAWKISAEYAYTGNAGKLYAYTFEAWTQSGTRNLHVKYYYDSDTNVSIVDHSITITTTRKSYTVYGEALPKSGKRYVSFELADQLGTVNIKMLEIKEYKKGVDVNDPSPLSGTITISPSTGVNINTQLTATYSGSETVSYQWKKGGVNVGTNSNKFTPTVGGSYTVTVSAEGYKDKTSAVVTVNDPSLATLSGNITISPTSAIVNTELTATYSGSEIVSYQWKKDGVNVGTNSNKFTPTVGGGYTVTVSAEGYKDKTSAVVIVNDPSLSTLSGNITISPNSGVTTFTQLTATYSGNETVNYQWQKDGVNVGTNSNKYTPTQAGSYTVTVSAEGYKDKTSAVVTVNDSSLATLSGNITISPTSAIVNTELTATYSGSETVSYHWEKDGSSIGTNSSKYTPTEAGSYTVTVRASGYNSKTSIAVTVTMPTNAIQLTANTWTDGNLPTSSDIQWFKFTATASTQYIHVSFGTLTDLYVQVYNSSGALVGSETNLYSSSTRYVSRTVTVGQEYYIMVRPYRDYSGTYQIAFNTLLVLPGTTITSLTENTWVDGNLPMSSDEQWFKFTATASTQYIHISFGTLDSLYVQVYNSSGGTVGSETWLYINNTTKYVSPSVTIGQEYYIKVWSYHYSYKSGTYRIAFNMTFHPPGTTTLTLENWVDGNIPTPSDEQWFKFTATASTQYIHVSFGTLTDLYVQVYNSSGAPVGSQIGLSDTTKYVSPSVTIGQEYYIRVWPYSASKSGTYRITFNATFYPPGVTTLTLHAWADGNIPTGSDVQWFKFTATASIQYIHVSFGSLDELHVQVYNSSGGMGGGETYFRDSTGYVSRTVTVGQEYYIRVRSNRNYSGTYQIGFTASTVKPMVPSNIILIQLTANTWADGNIPRYGEQWFKFTATASSQYIHFSEDTLGSIEVSVYDLTRGGDFVDSFTLGYSTTKIIGRTVTTGHECYIRVEPRPYSDSSGTYKIGFTESWTKPSN